MGALGGPLYVLLSLISSYHTSYTPPCPPPLADTDENSSVADAVAPFPSAVRPLPSLVGPVNGIHQSRCVSFFTIHIIFSVEGRLGADCIVRQLFVHVEAGSMLQRTLPIIPIFIDDGTEGTDTVHDGTMEEDRGVVDVVRVRNEGEREERGETAFLEIRASGTVLGVGQTMDTGHVCGTEEAGWVLTEGLELTLQLFGHPSVVVVQKRHPFSSGELDTLLPRHSLCGLHSVLLTLIDRQAEEGRSGIPFQGTIGIPRVGGGIIHHNDLHMGIRLGEAGFNRFSDELIPIVGRQDDADKAWLGDKAGLEGLSHS